MTQRDDLLAYLSQFDGSLAETPPILNPGDLTVTIAATAGQPAAFTRPFAELDITFSRPASGLEIGDLQIEPEPKTISSSATVTRTPTCGEMSAAAHGTMK